MYCIAIYQEYVGKILSETTKHRALIFGMCNHLVNLYQVLLNYAPWAKNGPATLASFSFMSRDDMKNLLV